MNKIGKCLVIVGIFLIGISSILYCFNTYKEYKTSIKTEEVLNVLKTNINKEDNNFIIDKVSDDTKDKSIDINGNNYIGTITIPKLELYLPIINKYSYDNLSIAPCIYYGSIDTNDLIICAHSYRKHFKNIINLKQNDRIIITDISGNNYIYEVLEIEILSPKDVSKMIDNDFDLTLYTCTKDGLNRVTVRCNRIFDSM